MPDKFTQPLSPVMQTKSSVPPVAECASRSKLTACVIADHWLGAAYLVGLLRGDPSIIVITLADVVGCCEIQQHAPVFVMDYGGLRLPFSQCLIALRRKFPSARYLVMGRERSDGDVMRIVQLGADGFIPYNDVDALLIRAVHALAAGEFWVQAHILKRLLQPSNRGIQQPDQCVTFRENQILELAKGRLTNKEIGAVLGIQESTVKYHLTNIFTKLGVNSRDDLLENPDPTGCWRRLLHATGGKTTCSGSVRGIGEDPCCDLYKTGA